MRNKPRADSNRSLLLLSCIFLLQACQGNLLPAPATSELTTFNEEENTVRLAAEYGAQIRTIESNGIELRIAEAGEGPLVILVHGWPESWFSWRYQLQALALAGYRAVAPDMRGYGGSTNPDEIEDYNILQLTADVVGIVDALNEESATLVGHDWGGSHCMADGTALSGDNQCGSRHERTLPGPVTESTQQSTSPIAR